MQLTQGKKWSMDCGTANFTMQEAFSLPVSFEWPAIKVNNLQTLDAALIRDNPPKKKAKKYSQPSEEDKTFSCPCLSLLIHWNTSSKKRNMAVSVPGLKDQLSRKTEIAGERSTTWYRENTWKVKRKKKRNKPSSKEHALYKIKYK